MQTADPANRKRGIIKISLALAALLAFLWFLVYAFDSWQTFDCFSLKGQRGIAQCQASLLRPVIMPSRIVSVKKRLATLLFDNKEYDAVIPILNEVIASGSASHIDFSNRGASLYWTNQNAMALADFKRAYELNPTDDAYLSDLVFSYLDDNTFDLPLELITKHAAANPNAQNIDRLTATVHYRSGNNTAAKAAILAAVSKFPDDAAAQNMLGLISEKLDEKEEALKAYGNAIKLEPGSATYLVNRADLYNDLDRLTDAETDYKSALNINRDSSILTALAIIYLDLDRLTEAKPLLDESLRLDENLPQTNNALGRYYVLTDDEGLAVKHLDRALALDPEFLIAKYWKSLLDYNKGRFGEALQKQKALLPAFSTSATLRSDIGDTLLELERYQEALASYSEAVTINPSNRFAFEGRARAHLALDNFLGAVSDANKAIAIDDKSAVAYYRRAYANWQLGNNDAAKADYDKAAALAPDRKYILADRAEFLFFDGNVDEARKIITQLVSAGQTWATITRMKGRLAEYDGDNESALANYLAASKEDPKNPWILEDIGWAQIANAQPATALETCNAMRKALPKSAEALRCRAKALTRMGRDAEALQDLQAATGEKPDFLPALLDLAYVQISLNRNEEAITTLAELVRKKYKVATSEYYRGLAFENLKQEHLALKSYETALSLADPYLAKDISTQLNRLRAKIPRDSLPSDLLYPQKTVRR